MTNKPCPLPHAYRMTQAEFDALTSEQKQELYSQYRDKRYDAMRGIKYPLPKARKGAPRK